MNSQDLKTMILTGLSLAFATIPEELPIIITMVLGLGAYTLSKDRLLIKKLKAAEALGNASVIVTDKTGTITENKMLIAGIFPSDKEKEILASALSAATDVSSTPIDKAVSRKAADYGLTTGDGRIIRERSFGDGRKTKSILRERDGKFMLYVTGAPEEILEIALGDKSAAEKTLATEADKGRRLIAVAVKAVAATDRDKPFAELEKGVTVTGLISFEDPARKGVDETIQKASRAGIRTIMVTGDHPRTAAYIAGIVGIPNEKVLTGENLDMLSEEGLQKMVRSVSVYARTTPEHKYRIVSALQKNGKVVAVTGDGVNDTLALKEADIGIAMGIRGTDAAKEAADIVLADDNFVTIGKGIFEGRKFYDNLRKGVKYYLSVKTALVLIFLMPILLNMPFLLAPIQIIVLELFMDLAASSAFVAEPAEKTIYTRPPRKPGEKFIDRMLLTEIFISGISLFAAIALSYYYASTQNASLALMQTYAFTAWIIGHMLLAFISRSETDPLYKLGLFSNKVMNYWALIVIVFVALVMGVPQVGAQLRVTPLDPMHIAVIAGICLVAICWQEAAKTITYNMKKVRQ